MQAAVVESGSDAGGVRAGTEEPVMRACLPPGEATRTPVTTTDAPVVTALEVICSSSGWRHLSLSVRRSTTPLSEQNEKHGSFPPPAPMRFFDRRRFRWRRRRDSEAAPPFWTRARLTGVLREGKGERRACSKLGVSALTTTWMPVRHDPSFTWGTQHMDN